MKLPLMALGQGATAYAQQTTKTRLDMKSDKLDQHEVSELLRSVTYLPVKCFKCGHKDAIRSDYYRPRGGEFWCDECGEETEYEPAS
jgi:predicted RNA-binding Zn-ribbon protein involved in translation (DUF1610 family)